jgi:putative PEP-CTERM system histidine kinase
VNDSWYALPGVWAYGAAALAFAWLSAQLVLHWHPGGKPAMLLAMAAASAGAAAAAVAFLIQPTLGLGWLVALLDFVRVAVTIGFLLALLGVRGGVRKAERGAQGWAPLIGLGLLLLTLWFLVGVRPPGIVEPNALMRQLAYGSALGVAVFGLVLVEQCYRRTPLPSRWHIRPLILGFAGLFAFDVALYSDALLFRTIDFDLWSARGFAQALTVPLILVTLRRRADWSFDLSVSRGVVAGSTALLLTGVYLLLLAGAGFLLRQFGGSWGRVLESVLVFGALLLLAALALSATFRAKVRVLVAKHFFTYRYDYREQWLRLTNTLTSGDAAHPWSACIQAIGALVESPGGALWFRSGDQGYRQVERLNFSTVSDALGEDEPLPRFLRKTNWILDIGDVRQRPANYEGLALPAGLANSRDAWLIVPLLTGAELVGFIVLSKPRVKVDLDWEVLDLLKTAGRQAAGYLAYAQATEALLEAQKFDAFNRMSTFVVHDLKNLIAQLQLLLSNAERHRDNPDFQRDMMRTIEHVVGRMHQLTLQLRPEASARERPQPVDVGAVARRIQSLRMRGRAGLSVEADAGILAWAHEDLLERVLSHLVQNGFDASEGGQGVQVKVERHGDEVLVEVTDQGRGMSPEFIRERLFKPFQTTKETGTGIGAFECQQYVQQVGGRIEVQSAPGKGTKVSVHLRGVAPARAGVEAAA